MSRRSIWIRLLALLMVVPLLAMPDTARAAEGDFIVDGGGWGHGVGMSQYGAFGMALDGMTVAEIIDYYYSGANLTPAGSIAPVPTWIFDPEALAVNVASKRDTLDFWVRSGNVEVCHRGDGTNECTIPDVTVSANQTLRVTGDGDACTRSVVDSDGIVVEESEVLGNCLLDLTWDDDFSGSAAENLVQVEELVYARGPFEVRPNTTGPTFDATVRLGLEEYLYGIGEMPLSWPAEALKAQAVTARSYAVALISGSGGADGSGRIADCGCHIRRTPAHQNYAAWIVEGAGSLGSTWRDLAVEGTNGLVVTHPEVSGGNAVAATYYSSSTGGATENVENVFGGLPQPHLKSRDDPWSIDPSVNNPYATWTANVTQAAVAEWLGWDEVRSMELVAGPPGSLILFSGFDEGAAVSAQSYGWAVREALDLRSPYISDVIREGPPPPPFTDIDASIHYDDIATIWRAGITKGCNPPANDLFCPSQPVTREQMASFLVRALGLGPVADDGFVDDTDSIHQDDINTLAAAGITKGCNPPANDQFCPGQAVTRGQMAAFLVRAYGYADAGDGDLFVDDDESIFAADIDRLAVAGITKGCNPPANDRFCPDDPVTREQMASFLARAATGG